ncbi:MAG TPA: peptidoglycan-binding domain-containing protein [Coleofasciculaceae cyanobacterium]|jgi:peptidoglycan hydrolase-like protein with peptidoglycan-binding domain
MLNSVSHTAPVNSYPIAWLQQGSTGTHVMGLQHILKRRGFNPGAIDGKFGIRTHTAVYRFQFSQSLSLTGSVDVETWQVLIEAQ